MRIARIFGSTVLAMTLTATLGGCWSGIYENPAAQYVNRSDTITLGAGNAKDVNAATHVIDPWPRNVANRRIPGNGERMVGAVQKYQRPQAARSPTQGQGGQGGQAGSSDIGAAPAAGAAPASNQSF